MAVMSILLGGTMVRTFMVVRITATTWVSLLRMQMSCQCNTGTDACKAQQSQDTNKMSYQFSHVFRQLRY